MPGNNFAILNNTALPTAANALFPARTHGRRGMRFHNNGAAVMTVTAPSGAQFLVAAGAVLELRHPFVEDGAYTVTGTATQTFYAYDIY